MMRSQIGRETGRTTIMLLELLRCITVDKPRCVQLVGGTQVQTASLMRRLTNIAQAAGVPVTHRKSDATILGTMIQGTTPKRLDECATDFREAPRFVDHAAYELAWPEVYRPPHGIAGDNGKLGQGATDEQPEGTGV